MAPRHGFEPRFTAPKAAVLPLDDRGKAQAGLFLVILTRPSLILSRRRERWLRRDLRLKLLHLFRLMQRLINRRQILARVLQPTHRRTRLLAQNAIPRQRLTLGIERLSIPRRRSICSRRASC